MLKVILFVVIMVAYIIAACAFFETYRDVFKNDKNL